MNQRFYWFFYEARYSGYIIFVGVFSILTTWYTVSGVFSFQTLPGWRSQLEPVGQALMLIILPSYLAVAIVFAQRRSLLLSRQIESQQDFDFTHHVVRFPERKLFVGMVAGFVFSFLNLPGDIRTILSGEDRVLIAIALGQMLMWTFVGLLFALRYHVARAFYEAGRQVDLDLFEVSNLKFFGQAGLTDALLIVIAMVITTLQSLDTQIRLYNYINTFLVTLPAITVLMVTPMYSVHRRIVEMKHAEFQRIRERLRAVPKDLNVEHMGQLELLLQRRDRLGTVSSWPIDISIVSRLLLYIVVPPLAWIGAAYVEIVLDAILSGS
jgi:hypothetical protein